jgi:hypothetical protein
MYLVADELRGDAVQDSGHLVVLDGKLDQLGKVLHVNPGGNVIKLFSSRH